MTWADTQEGVLLRGQWYPLPNGSHVYLLQSNMYYYHYQGRTPNISRSDFETGLEPNRLVFVVHTQTAGGLPGLVAYTSFKTFLSITMSVSVYSPVKLYSNVNSKCINWPLFYDILLYRGLLIIYLNIQYSVYSSSRFLYPMLCLDMAWS